MSIWTANLMLACQCHRTSRYGGRSALAVTPRPADPSGLSPFRNGALMRCATCGTGKIKSVKLRGSRWQDNRLVFTTRYGTALNPANVRCDFRRAFQNAIGLDARERTPRELHHSFVSLLSDNDMPLDEISRLIGHKSTVVSELVYASRSGLSCKAARRPWTVSSGPAPGLTQSRSHSFSPKFPRHRG